MTSALRVLTCRHAGPPAGDLLPCRPCAGKVRLKLYPCAMHGQTTEPECRRCLDYAPREVPASVE
jgi:hypothetical protein